MLEEDSFVENAFVLEWFVSAKKEINALFLS
jgi:hypothetical protein